MSASDVVAVVAAVLVAVLVGVVVAMLAMLARALVDLRGALERLRDDAVPLLADLRDAVTEAGLEVDRVERLVSSAEQLEEALGGASRRAYRTVANPVVKAMAFGSGVSRAARVLRSGPQSGDGSSRRETRREARRRKKAS